MSDMPERTVDETVVTTIGRLEDGDKKPGVQLMTMTSVGRNCRPYLW